MYVHKADSYPGVKLKTQVQHISDLIPWCVTYLPRKRPPSFPGVKPTIASYNTTSSLNSDNLFNFVKTLYVCSLLQRAGVVVVNSEIVRLAPGVILLESIPLMTL
jgi:hypothetical protein